MSHTLKSGNVRFHYNSDFSGDISIVNLDGNYPCSETTVKMTDILRLASRWYYACATPIDTSMAHMALSWIYGTNKPTQETPPINEPSTPFDWGVAPKEDHAAWRDIKKDWVIIRTRGGLYGWSIYNRKHEDVENTVEKGIEVAKARAMSYGFIKTALMGRIRTYESLPGNPKASRLRAVYHALRKFHWDMEKQEAEKGGVHEGHGGKVFVNGREVGTLKSWTCDINGLTSYELQ